MRNEEAKQSLHKVHDRCYDLENRFLGIFRVVKWISFFSQDGKLLKNKIKIQLILMMGRVLKK